MISPQPEDSDIMTYKWAQLLVHLRWENKFAIGKFRYALAVLAPDTEESVALLFEFLKTAVGIEDTFIFLHCINYS
jgi:hypothetical protein